MSFSSGVVKTTFGADVRALVDAFLLLGKNEILTYKQCGELIHKAVDGASPEYQTARERLARDFGIEIKTIKKIGGMRLDDGGIVGELPRDRASVDRKVKRSLRRAGNVENYGALSNGEKLEYDRHLATLGIMRELQRPRPQRAIENRVQTGMTTIDVDLLVAVLRK